MHPSKSRLFRTLFSVALLVGVAAVDGSPAHAAEILAPTAYGEDYTTAEDTALEIAAPGLLANDSDPDVDGLSVQETQGSGGGSLSVTPDGWFRYVPQANANGADFFIYNVTDGVNVSNYATVNITITPVNDPPVAISDAFDGAEDTPLAITAAALTANDTDVEGAGLSAVLTVAPLNGTITGDFVYTPNLGFTGTDTFSYIAFDNLDYSGNAATVILTVQGVNHPPVAVDDAFSTPQDTPLTIAQVDLAANDSDPDGDLLTLAVSTPPTHGVLGTGDTEAELVYVPNSGFTGTDRFTYVLYDGSMAKSSPATVTLTVTSTDDDPTPTAAPRPTIVASPRPTEPASSGGSHADVIARITVDFGDDPLAWTVAELDAGERATEVAAEGDPGFLLGVDGAAQVRDGDGAPTRLDPGEALGVHPDDELSVQSADGDPANLALLGLRGVHDDEAADDGEADVAFESPGGTREVNLVRDVLSQGERVTLDAANAPIFVLVTEGAIELETEDGEIVPLAAAETAPVTGEIVVMGTDAETSSFVATVIGPEIDATPSATPLTATVPARAKPSPQPTESAEASTPRPPAPSPTPPTPAGDGPDDDPDGDGLSNGDEAAHGTDPFDYDTDNDGFGDGDEIADGTDPQLEDTNGDGLTDPEEAFLRTNPTKFDTDGDLFSDGGEFSFHSDPLNPDTDGDGALDGDEVNAGTNFLNPDTDDDGLTDTEEAFLRTNPNDADTDDDYLRDGAEVYDERTDPFDYDTDDDGWSDGSEIRSDTDPKDPESTPSIYAG